MTGFISGSCQLRGGWWRGGGIKVGERVLRLPMSVTVINKPATRNTGGILSTVEMPQQCLTVVMSRQRHF